MLPTLTKPTGRPSASTIGNRRYPPCAIFVMAAPTVSCSDSATGSGVITRSIGTLRSTASAISASASRSVKMPTSFPSRQISTAPRCCSFIRSNASLTGASGSRQIGSDVTTCRRVSVCRLNWEPMDTDPVPCGREAPRITAPDNAPATRPTPRGESRLRMTGAPTMSPRPDRPRGRNSRLAQSVGLSVANL